MILFGWDRGLIPEDDQGKPLPVTGNGDTFAEYHTYEIDWNPESITWSVDGDVMRTLNKKETFNKTDNQYHYPQTPARVQLSLWPAGIKKNAEGTIDWAGGLINWNSQDVQNNGYYYSLFQSVNVDCYDAPPGANVSGKTSYVYTDNKGVESSIAITGEDTVLKSLLGTGTDKDKDYPKAAGTKSAGAAATSGLATIPGLTGAGPGTDGTRGGDSSGGSSGGSGDSGGSGGATSASASGAAATGGIGGFEQGSGGDSKGSGAAKIEEVAMGSMFAALMAFVGMLIMI